MGLRGPPPKPTALKLLEGTFRADRAAPNEPAPDPGLPSMPPHLVGVGADAWEFFGAELLKLGVLTVRDGAALELLCDAYAEWRAAREVVQREGMTYESGTKNGHAVIAHPAVRIAADAWRRMHRMLVEFGLTPAARARVTSVRPQPQLKSRAEWIRGGRRTS